MTLPFRPAPLPTVIVAGAMAIQISLGFWQLGRHEAAKAHVAEVEANLYGEPATEADLSAAPSALAWRKAVISGSFLGEPSLIAGHAEFGENGYELVQTFQPTTGPTLLVHRGWIPAAAFETHLRTTAPTGPVTLEGLLLDITGPTDSQPLPADSTHPERWVQDRTTWLGMPRLLGPPYASIAARASPPPGLVLVVGPALTKGQAKAREPLPVTGYVAQPKHIGHLEYALQWFLIAATLFVIWAGASWRRGLRLRAAARP